MSTGNTIEITSLVDFLNWIKKSKQPDNNFVRFYRGQNIDKFPTPSIFRDNINSDEENSMFYEVINRKPEEFSNCKCTFDYLVKMQHYNLPTRLLDITSNPLVALYFACENVDKDSTSTIFTFDIPKELIKNYNSDSVTILSNLAKCTDTAKKDIDSLAKGLRFLKDNIRGFLGTKDYEFVKKDIDIYNYYSQNNDILFKDFESYIFTKYNGIPLFNMRDIGYNERKLMDLFEKIHTIFRKNYEFSDAIKLAIKNIENGYLLHEIKQDKPYFQDIMRSETFETVFCVNPKLDNPRIIAQSGSFLIFPRKIEEKEGLNSIKLNNIYIPLDRVSGIKKDLALLNIKEDILFNELAKVCESVKNKYPKKSN